MFSRCFPLVLSNALLLALLAGVLALAGAIPAKADDADMLSFTVRSRMPLDEDGGFRVAHERAQWDPAKTAAVVCDMWDQHWCEGAARRVAEMAPRMNRLLNTLRDQGVLIIHAPSGTMEFYEGTPQRELARNAPPVETEVPVEHWMGLDPEREAPLPIDDSDGGCDCEPQCEQGSPWSRQIETIAIAEEDAVTDSAEAYYLMRERGIENVFVMGVHTNMCVLGRPFAIRQMVTQGQNTVLVRDMTDAMYNPRREPYVPHAAGTDLVAAHIEKYWCPSTTSASFVDQPPFRFEGDDRPHVVLIASEDEYRAEDTLPEFGRKLRDDFDFKVSMLHANPDDRHDVPGMKALYGADAAILYARRHALKPNQMEALRDYLEAGKPLIALRTSSHAFDTRGETPDDRVDWPEFDGEVLGGSYSGHHGSDTTTRVDVVPARRAIPCSAAWRSPSRANPGCTRLARSRIPPFPCFKAKCASARRSRNRCYGPTPTEIASLSTRRWATPKTSRTIASTVSCSTPYSMFWSWNCRFNRKPRRRPPDTSDNSGLCRFPWWCGNGVY
ncbi:MAG: cysteine hydrolase family protein [Candidatus Hydrogenedentota bacterium]